MSSAQGRRSLKSLFLMKVPTLSTTAAEEDSTVLFIRREDVLQLCLDRPIISLAAVRLLAGRLRACASMIESLSLRDVDRRLAQLLLEEASDYGRRTGKSVEFQLSLTHQQIAARIGSVREVVSRAFNRIQQSGLIRTKAGAFSSRAKKRCGSSLRSDRAVPHPVQVIKFANIPESFRGPLASSTSASV